MAICSEHLPPYFVVAGRQFGDDIGEGVNPGSLVLAEEQNGSSLWSDQQDRTKALLEATVEPKDDPPGRTHGRTICGL